MSTRGLHRGGVWRGGHGCAGEGSRRGGYECTGEGRMCRE